MMNPTSLVRRQVEALRAQHAQYVEAAVWTLVWLVISPCVMLSIKTLTSDSAYNFPYPWMLIGFSNMGTWLVCQALYWMPSSIRWKGLQMADGQAAVPWRHAVAIGLLQGFEVGLGADIIHRISLTLRTEINMLCPAFMFLFGLAVGTEVFNTTLLFSIGIVTIGGLLASYGTMTYEGLDMVPLALLASVFSGIRWVLTQKWLSPQGEAKPSPILLALRMSPFTGLVGFAVAAVREPNAYKAIFEGLYPIPYPYQVTGLLACISVGVCVILVAEMRVVQLTSALLLGVMVPFHNVSVILMDVAMKGATVSHLNWIGIGLCAVASGFYFIARTEQQKIGMDQCSSSLVADPPGAAVPAYQSTVAGP